VYKKDHWDLESEIINFEGNSWRIRDACEGVICFGATGSGKSSAPLRQIAISNLENQFGGIVFCVKPDEKETWIKYVKLTGRTDDLLFLSEESFNFLDYERSRQGKGAGQIENIVELFMQVSDAGIGKKQNEGTNDRYWKDAVKQLLRNAITLLIMAEEKLTLQNIKKLIDTVPKTSEGIECDGNYCCSLINKVKQQNKELDAEFDLLWTYFLVEMPQLDTKTKSNILSSFSVVADSLLRGEMRRTFCAEESSFSPEMILDGKILIVDFNIKQWNKIGSMAGAIIKYCFMQAAERRERNFNENSMRPVFLFADEAQCFAIAYDQMFQTTARSSRVATVYATQNIGNLQTVYGKDETASLLGNLGTKILTQNGDDKTNLWASESIGKTLIMRKNISKGEGHNVSGGSGNSNNESYSEGWSEQKDFLVDPMEFTVLSKGGEGNNCNVEFFLWQSGRLFKDGKRFLKASIKQECKMGCGAKKEYGCAKKTPNRFIARIKRIFGVMEFLLLLLSIASMICSWIAYYWIMNGKNELLKEFIIFDKHLYITWKGVFIIGFPLAILSFVWLCGDLLTGGAIKRREDLKNKAYSKSRRNNIDPFLLFISLSVMGYIADIAYKKIINEEGFSGQVLFLFAVSIFIRVVSISRENKH